MDFFGIIVGGLWNNLLSLTMCIKIANKPISLSFFKTCKLHSKTNESCKLYFFSLIIELNSINSYVIVTKQCKLILKETNVS